jgi:DNA (cytosine-5)-methyltransferase 1
VPSDFVAVDLFAGLGGFTAGAAEAGVPVVWAANHWPLAVEYHRRNHPEVAHACQDLHQTDWAQVPRHDLLLASPACQGHANARGKEQPRHDTSRSTAWAVVSALECHRTPFAVVENVPEFRRWSLYPAWRSALEILGYSLAEHLVDAADHGVPQHRVRLFLVLARSRAPLRLTLPARPHVPVEPLIEWDRYRWSPIEGHAPATIARITAGRAAFGDRFVAPYYGSGSGETGRSLARPLGTVTTRDRWSLVDGDRMRMLQPSEYLGIMGFRPGYRVPAVRKDAIHLLGNAVCPPVVRDVIEAIRRAA